MRKDNRLLRNCGKITAILILMSLLKPYPMFGEQLTGQPPILSEGETRYYSDLEIELLIDELSEAALEAIEKAAGEAAKAAALAMLEREATALREASLQQAEASRWRIEAEANLLAMKAAKRNGVKNTILGIALGILGGLAVGIGGTLILTR